MLAVPTGDPVRDPVRDGVAALLPLPLPLPTPLPVRVPLAVLLRVPAAVRVRVPLADALADRVGVLDAAAVRVPERLLDTVFGGVPGGEGEEGAAAGVGNAVLVWDGVSGVEAGEGKGVRVGERTPTPDVTAEVTSRLWDVPVRLVKRKQGAAERRPNQEKPVQGGVLQQAARQSCTVAVWSNSANTSPSSSE